MYHICICTYSYVTVAFCADSLSVQVSGDMTPSLQRRFTSLQPSECPTATARSHTCEWPTKALSHRHMPYSLFSPSVSEPLTSTTRRNPLLDPPVSYSMDKRNSTAVDKTAGEWIWPLTSICVQFKNEYSYTSIPTVCRFAQEPIYLLNYITVYVVALIKVKVTYNKSWSLTGRVEV